MQTNFSLAQLADPDVAASEGILRTCVHCGFCTATCPTYVMLGDELDSPRGRIYLLKEMLEKEQKPSEKVVKHIDRCLSCLSCMSTCPSGVHYMHLVDHGRKYIAGNFKRPAIDRLLRRVLAIVLPNPNLFRLSLLAAGFAKPFASLLPEKVRPMLKLAPAQIAPPSDLERPQVVPAQGTRRGRVALLTGCAQKVLAPQINEATVRLLTRLGLDVVIGESGCCGALTHHMGDEHSALSAAKKNVAIWQTEMDGDGLNAIVINASGCGTTVKDYGFMLRSDPQWAESADRISRLTCDVSEVVERFGEDIIKTATGLDELLRARLRVTYHSACSLQHGQKIKALPAQLLRAAGYNVATPAEAHLCCGSAGTYNILQPELAGRLKARKLSHLAATAPDVIATGNIGCMTQLASGNDVPLVHTVELLDWATGGPRPTALH
ncbi:MAG: glycolate oxidase subunit GlcF [Pseudomonadota bacterium]